MSLVLDQTERDYLENLAFVYVQHGKYDNGRIILSSLHKCFPEDLYPIKGLAYIYMMEGDKEKSLEFVKKALEIDEKEELSKAIMMLVNARNAKTGAIIDDKDLVKAMKDNARDRLDGH